MHVNPDNKLPYLLIIASESVTFGVTPTAQPVDTAHGHVLHSLDVPIMIRKTHATYYRRLRQYVGMRTFPGQVGFYGRLAAQLAACVVVCTRK